MSTRPRGPTPNVLTVIQENNAGFADPAALTEQQALGGGPAHVEDHELGSDASASLGRLAPHSRGPVAGALSRHPPADGRPELARDRPMALSRGGDDSSLGAGLERRRAARLGARADPGAPSVTHGGATDAGQSGGPPLPSGGGLPHARVDHHVGPALYLDARWDQVQPRAGAAGSACAGGSPICPA